MRISTVGHGTRPADELLACLREAAVETLVDVRRFPGSRRNPQFNQAALAETLREAGIAYRHAVELGGRLSGEPGAERFPCIRVAAFRSYAARMGTDEWQQALGSVLAARGKRYVMANVPRAKLEEVKRVVPGLNGPTIIDIMNGGHYVAVHAVVSASTIYRTIADLKALGAEGILVTRIERLMS